MAILDNGIEELAAGQQIVFAHTANNVVGVLAVACGSSDTTISLSPGGGALFPNAPFYCSIEFEVLWCLSKSGDNLIVQRGQDGTVAQAHAVAVAVEMRNNAGLWSDAYNGINAVSADVGTLQSNILNKTALPPDTTFNNATQELTHKTIDLADSSKQNVIIGNVQPDPAALVYQNILINGGFDDWSYPTSTTLSAGTPTSGARSADFITGWNANGINDSAITVARDSANTDPAYPSGYNLLINASTVQGTDFVSIEQGFIPGNQVAINDLKKVVNNPFSISARVKSISGNIQVRFRYWYNDGTNHFIYSPLIQATAAYATIKFENQIWIPNVNVAFASLAVEFQGVGQVALDNVMLILGPVATTHRPSFPSITNNRLAPNVQRANLLTNGGFEIWQRGNGPFTANGQWPGDRWYISLGGGSISVTKQTGGGGSLCGGAYTHSAVSAISQDIKIVEPGYEVLPGKTLSLSILVYSSAPNAVQARLFTVGSAANIDVRSAFHPGNSTYQRFTVTANIPPDATLINVGVLLSASCTFYIGQAMMVLGSVPADYVPMHPADDLARCLRYYEVIGDVYPNPTVFGYSTIGQNFGQYIPYVRKAVSPTATKNGTWTVTNTSQPTVFGSSLYGMDLVGVATATGNASFNPTAAGQNITIEANP